MGNRWQMNRIGFVHFWLYDEETFTFADGKLLLRGQNGSGKSITTQSFIPFILDGDRTPSRLDPFGSSDRRMEYYFLGEGEQNEATGYLFLEFKRENTQQYRTIGIGQKAQKGKSMNFWGFVILDGKRIGYDMNLYTSVGSTKIPLTKQELKKELGEENLFTEGQKEYMSFVNKYLFGFPRQEQYEQFVRLLIKVRAPKLSKEFKPTKVYEILNDSLQQLSDDDLRTMVEAMENMDDIQGRLDDLKLAFKDLQVLRTIYIRYNCYMLGKKAQAYLEEKRKVDGVRGKLEAKESEVLDKQEEMKNSQGEVASLAEDLDILETEKQALNMEELEASIDKLDDFKKSKDEAKEEEVLLSGRIEERRERIRSLDVEKRTHLGEVQIHHQEMNGCLKELEENNHVILFEMHDSIKRLPENHNNKILYQSVREELEVLEHKIKAGGKALSDLVQITEEWDKGEQELYKRQVAMKQACEQLEEVTSLEHECRDKLIESFHVCTEKNTELIMTRENLGLLVSRIYQYDGAKDLGEIHRHLHQIWEQQNQELLKSRLQYQNSKEEVLERKRQLQQELEALLHMQDPVRQREQRVEEARRRLKDQKISFLPFYQAVEFTDGMVQEEKDRIECQIADAGLLDALVVVAGDYERAKMELRGLSDILICAVPSGEKPYAFLEPGDVDPLLKKAIEGILSNICEENNRDGTLLLSRDGYFRNGILEGYSIASEEASFIGINARKRKKERLIAEKKKELTEAEESLTVFLEKIEEVQKRITVLQEEYGSLPAFDDLDQAIDLVKSSNDALERCKGLYEEQEEFVTQLEKRKKAFKQKVIFACKNLPYQQELEAYQAALEAVEDYEKCFNGLVQILTYLELDEERCRRVQDAINKEEESIDVDYEYLRKAQKKEKELEVQIRHIEDYLNSPETKVKAERLRQIKDEMKEKNESREKLNEKLVKLETLIEVLSGEIAGLKKDAVEQIERETKLREYFREELDLGLVTKQEDAVLYEAARRVKDCIKDGDKNRSGIEMTTSLMKTFQAHIGTLLSYGALLEEYFPDDGFDPSVLRARQQIVFIWNGKRLYLEEFYTVIKESIESNELLIQQKDRELFEGILADTLSRKLSNRIGESRRWINDMSSLMRKMDTSMALTFSLEWKPKGAEGEMELDTRELEAILCRDRELLTTEDIEKVSIHFRTKIQMAKQSAEENGDIINYVDLVRDALDYRKWFEFKMYYYRNGENKKELTNGAFNRFSGGEKAMAMYVPLFAAVNAQYKKSESQDHPRMIAMDEAFAGVDDKNISSMFEMVEKLDFDYIMNSQVLWGCYETVKSLRIAELLRPANANVVTVIYYYWNGQKRVLDEQ